VQLTGKANKISTMIR